MTHERRHPADALFAGVARVERYKGGTACYVARAPPGGGNPVSTASSITAFISYSWDSDAHKAWTRDLGARLRSDGVAVGLDQWELVPSDQLPEFMERSIRDSAY